ncbi:MAG: hypothetical protein K6C94_10230 [Candidatus Gastranaerophilales bacterium]|nr:hypothetical protein [Candidatus Gastranaerophilales bacterium]
MKKKIIISVICAIFGLIFLALLAFFLIESEIIDDLADLFDNKKSKTTIQTTKQRQNTSKPAKLRLFGPKTKITKNNASSASLQTYNNGLVSMKIPKGWVVGVGNSDYIHYTFMAYDPKNPDYKIFFNMKTEGYLKTQQMRNFYKSHYPNAPFAILPAINPQTTTAFYKVFTQAYAYNQQLLPFKVPVIKNYTPVQTLGRNITGGAIERAVYQNEQGKKSEGIFTATIKEVPMPPVVILIVYNTVFYTVPEGELVDWLPVLNGCVSSIRFSDKFINGYYQQQGQVVKNAQAIQAICNQTSDIITSGWNQRQKTYDILSQKRSDATMGYERVQDTDTGEIYKATVGFTDHDWHGKYVPITDDMYNLPTAGYIEKE